MELQSDLSEFVGLLISRGVEFLIVGGYAVAFHGHPRLTGDIDFFIRRTPENAERIARALDDFGFGTFGVKQEDFIVPDRVLQDTSKNRGEKDVARPSAAPSPIALEVMK